MTYTFVIIILEDKKYFYKNKFLKSLTSQRCDYFRMMKYNLLIQGLVGPCLASAKIDDDKGHISKRED